MSMDKWRWFGCPGHLIVASHCRFHLHTRIGNYRISTVGAYWPERAVREIHAQVSDPAWLAENGALKGDYFDHAYMKRFGFESIGADRLYETMVFRISGEGNDGEGEVDWSEIDFAPADDEVTATVNHMKMCRKYDRKGATNGKPR